MLVKARQFLTKAEQNPLPLRTMRVVEILRDTQKAIHVKLVGTPLPTSECVHCGREITHPQSLHFGIGSTCIKKYPQLLEVMDYNEIEKSYEALKDRMTKITWEGWLPKSCIELIDEAPNGWEIVFTHGEADKPYHVITKDAEKVAHIHANANVISCEEVTI